MAEIATSGVRQPRPTTHINRKPASNLRQAVRMAEAIGRPLNQVVTLNFAKTECEPQHTSSAFERLRDNYYGPWLRRAAVAPGADGPPAFVWVIENSGGHTHAHWMVHVPPHRQADFAARIGKWMLAVAGEVQPGAINIRAAYNPRGFAKYMLKGINPADAFLYRIRPYSQGVVFDKRSGFSRSLGPVARKRIGLKALKWRRLEASITATGRLPAP
jgi:hypothetical protein